MLLLLAGVSIGAGAAFAVDDAALVGRSTVAALAQVPAAWVLTSVALAVFGWAPRLAGAVWGLLLAFVALGEFGVLWNAPEWLMDLSPFRHSPLLPVGSGAVPALAGPYRGRGGARGAGLFRLAPPRSRARRPCLSGCRQSVLAAKLSGPATKKLTKNPFRRQ